MMPVNSPFTPGNIAGGDPQLVVGGWVIGFYIWTPRNKTNYHGIYWSGAWSNIYN